MSFFKNLNINNSKDDFRSKCNNDCNDDCNNGVG